MTYMGGNTVPATAPAIGRVPQWLTPLTAVVVLLLGAVVALAGDDLPVQPPEFKRPEANKGPGVPGPLEEPEPEGEDPRDAPAPVFFGEEIDGTDTIVYVLDRSGSMIAGTTGYSVRHVQSPSGATRMVEWALPGQQDWSRGGWTGCSRWERGQIETIKSVEGLAANLKFDVVTFDCVKYWAFGKAVEASAANKAKARAWILGQQAGGGTDTGYATALALGYADVDAVVLLTDGVPECMDGGTNDEVRARHRRVIVTANRRRVPVHVFGIGIPNGYVRSFCTSLANENQGTYTEVR